MAKNFRLDVQKAVALSRTSIRSGSYITFSSASTLTSESGSVINLYSPILMPVASASFMPAPNEGTGSLYVKATDNNLYFQDDAGVEYDLLSSLTPGGELTASNILIDGSTSGSVNFVNDGVIYIPDNDSTALSIQEATNQYINFNTTNGSEVIAFLVSPRIRDDIKLNFGNADDAHIEYDENGSDALIISGSSNNQSLAFSGSAISASCQTFTVFNNVDGKGARLHLIADQGGDASDDATIGVGSGGALNVESGAGMDFQAAASSEVVFNEDAADVDFRVESADNSRLFTIDGGTSQVNIGYTATDFVPTAQAAALSVLLRMDAGANAGFTASGGRSFGEYLWLGSTTSSTQGAVYFLDYNSGAKVKIAQADSTSKDARGMLLFANGNTVNKGMLVRGYCCFAAANVDGSTSCTAATQGKAVYVSRDNAGRVTLTAPSGDGEIIRQVGYVAATISTTDIIVYWTPSTDYIEYTT